MQAAQADAEPLPRTQALAEAAPELKLRVLAGLGSPHELRSCWAVCPALRGPTEEYVVHVLRSPWWLLSVDRSRVLAAALAFLPVFSMLRAASVCRGWRAASRDRAAWRAVRLNFGWGLDSVMRGVLCAMRRMALFHGLPSFPEDPPECQAATSPRHSPSLAPRSPPSSPLSKPASPASRGLGSLPPSPTARSRPEAIRPSPLLLCRHGGLEPEVADSRAGLFRQERPAPSSARPDLWLLQAEEERRTTDPLRHAACRFLARNAKLFAGKSVLEVEAGAGLVGLFAAYHAKSVTITTPTELGSRLARLNGTLVGTDWGKRVKGWTGISKRQIPSAPGRTGPVPLYVYALPMTQQGVEELTRQWQWDSGTAMRSMRPEFCTPRFEVVVHAALCGPPGSRSRERARGFATLAAGLLSDEGLAIAAAGESEAAPLDALAEEVAAAGLLVEREELAEDPAGNSTRFMLLRRIPDPM